MLLQQKGKVKIGKMVLFCEKVSLIETCHKAGLFCKYPVRTLKILKNN